MPGSSGLFSIVIADTESDCVARSLRRGQSNDGISIIIPKNSMNVGSEHEISTVAVSTTTTTGSGIGVVLVVGPLVVGCSLVVEMNAESVFVRGGVCAEVVVLAFELFVLFIKDVVLEDESTAVDVLNPPVVVIALPSVSVRTCAAVVVVVLAFEVLVVFAENVVLGVEVLVVFVEDVVLGDEVFVVCVEDVVLEDDATRVDELYPLVVVITPPSVSVRTCAAVVVVVLAFEVLVVLVENVVLGDDAAVVDIPNQRVVAMTPSNVSVRTGFSVVVGPVVTEAVIPGVVGILCDNVVGAGGSTTTTTTTLLAGTDTEGTPRGSR